jgi:hypothetical protein
VHSTVRRHSPSSGDESLAGHLAAEDALQVLVGAAASEVVDLDPFQVEELDEHALRGRHRTLLWCLAVAAALAWSSACGSVDSCVFVTAPVLRGAARAEQDGREPWCSILDARLAE